MSAPTPARAGLRALPAGIWALGFGSLLMDSSSELVHSLLPVYMTTVLGASMATVGLVEGIAEATAAITKVFSGALSDRRRGRKRILLLGYGLAALTKPVFPLASSVAWVLGGRFLDRIGKGIRGAPRDALVADLTPLPLRGAAYGLRQSLDSVGACIGPLLAVAFMAWLADLRATLWIAVVPAALAVGLLAAAVRDPDPSGPGATRRPLSMAEAARLPAAFWLVVLLGAVFTLARFSEAFLVLRAHELGLVPGMVPVVMIAMNAVYAVTAYPAGVAADRLGRRSLLLAGIGALCAADLVLAAARTPAAALVGAGLWGLHMGATQGLFAKLVADAAPADARGTAFGVYNLVSGVALLLASGLAGWLWGAFGAPATFLAGAGFAALTALGLLARRRSA